MILNIYKSDLVALCYDLHLCLIVNSAAAEINVLKPEVLWRSLPKLGNKKMQKIVIFVSFTNLLLILVSLPSRIIVNKIHVRICRPSPLPSQLDSWRHLYLILFWTPSDGDSSVPWK